MRGQKKKKKFCFREICKGNLVFGISDVQSCFLTKEFYLVPLDQNNNRKLVIFFSFFFKIKTRQIIAYKVYHGGKRKRNPLKIFF